jgi:hypothetical protein
MGAMLRCLVTTAAGVAEQAQLCFCSDHTGQFLGCCARIVGRAAHHCCCLAVPNMCMCACSCCLVHLYLGTLSDCQLSCYHTATSSVQCGGLGHTPQSGVLVLCRAVRVVVIVADAHRGRCAHVSCVDICLSMALFVLTELPAACSVVLWLTETARRCAVLSCWEGRLVAGRCRWVTK